MKFLIIKKISPMLFENNCLARGCNRIGPAATQNTPINGLCVREIDGDKE